MHEVIFEKGSDHAFINLDFKKDGLWEGVEKGIITIDKVISQKNVISDWRNSTIEILINDLDSLHDGSGNNQRDNDLGIAGAIQQRLSKEAYGDGRSTPGGSDRESARVISNDVIDQQTEDLNKRNLSDFVWAWGQFIDHDIVSTQSGTEKFSISIPEGDFLRTNKDLEFCDQPDDSLEIEDPDLGPGYTIRVPGTPANHFAFTRSQGVDDAQGVRQHRNETTAFLDGSVVYGANTSDANQLRTFSGGRLKIGDDGLLPVIETNKGNGFLAGDRRAAENPLLSSLQTLWVRDCNVVTQIALL